MPYVCALTCSYAAEVPHNSAAGLTGNGSRAPLCEIKRNAKSGTISRNSAAILRGFAGGFGRNSAQRNLHDRVLHGWQKRYYWGVGRRVATGRRKPLPSQDGGSWKVLPAPRLAPVRCGLQARRLRVVRLHAGPILATSVSGCRSQGPGGPDNRLPCG